MIQAWAARESKGRLEPYEYDPGELGPEDVEIAVEHCGICHSDLSIINNEWGISAYPVVPGHEVVGTIVDMGPLAKGLSIGQRVGVGWMAGSCMHCNPCIGGDQNLCPIGSPTIVGRHGGFADRVRVQWPWAFPLPEGLEPAEAGPLMCGGVTVYTPFEELDIRSSDRVGVVGIGGLGHLALKFANAWGCEVTAFTSSDSKADEARSFGAHHIVNSRDDADIARAAGTLDLLIVTVNVPLNWRAMIGTLGPKGRMHFVGAVLKPVPVIAMELIMQQRGVTGSPNGAPITMRRMLDFAARHRILPQTEHFPISQVNEALAHLDAGKARYRIVLDI